MAVRLFLVAVLAFCASHAEASGAQYPAGVSPQSCPNYPNCDNAALHGGAGNANPWGAPSGAANPWAGASPSWNSPASPAAAAQYPAGVDPQSCPNYPNCDNAALHGRAPAAPAWGAPAAPAWGAPAAPAWGSSAQGWNGNWNPSPAAPAAAPQYPAGVNPQSCPNYPYC